MNSTSSRTSAEVVASTSSSARFKFRERKNSALKAPRTARIDSAEKPARRSPIRLIARTVCVPSMMQNGGTSRLVRDSPRKQRQPADAHELVDDAVAGDEAAVAELDVARQQRAAGDDRLVADRAVVGDVAVLHEVVAVADARLAPGLGAAVDRRVLAEHVAVADAQERLRAAERDVLRHVADHRPAMDDVVGPDLRPAGDDGMRRDPRAGADSRGPFDHHVGPDRGARIDLGTAIDDRGRVDHWLSSSSGVSESGGRSPAMRYLSDAQLPRSRNLHRSEQNGR